MEELYIYMRAKMAELQETRNNTVVIDCVEFMQLMKVINYMKQIQRIVDDEI